MPPICSIEVPPTCFTVRLGTLYLVDFYYLVWFGHSNGYYFHIFIYVHVCHHFDYIHPQHSLIAFTSSCSFYFCFCFHEYFYSWISYLKEYIWYLCFWVWLILLIMMISSSFHIPGSDVFRSRKWHILLYIYIPYS
jgi:hypothetical protein